MFINDFKNFGVTSASSSQKRPAGYAFLTEKYQLAVIPNWHISYIGENESFWYVIQENQVEETYPAQYWPGEDDAAQLQFALQHDTVNPGILSALFEVIPQETLLQCVREYRQEDWCRVLWFLYEFLTGKQLELLDLTEGEEVPVLDSRLFYTLAPGEFVPRQRVLNNLTGDAAFCPLIRRTDKLAEMEKKNLQARCEEVVKSYPPDLLKRALTYLHKKETRSSFEIEHIQPDNSRTGKFVTLLERAEQTDFCRKEQLIEIQNQVVDERFRDSDYRTDQNYVGQSISHRREIIHYICPKPEDLPMLMEGLLHTHQMMKNGSLHPVVHAAAVAFAFVFMHPFNDGNGRIHRFLINNILSQSHFIPSGITFPISAAMLKDPKLYDQALEAFSKPLIKITQYTLDAMGRMTVHNETARWYRYVDMTVQTEALFEFIARTIEDELVEELDFLNQYDKTKEKLQSVVDMPDQLVDLFIRLCGQNGGRLSSKKRKDHFSFLSDEELTRMESIVQEGYRFDPSL